jgi:general secretion pathway protein H
MISNSKYIKSCPGFTLIEMITVLLILSVTIALVAPRVGSSWKKLEDGDFLQEFTETIKRARLLATNSGQPVSFRLNGAERVYDIANPPQKLIPLNVEVFSERLQKDPSTGDFLITFYPDGSMVGNDVDVVFDHTRTFRISIHPLFGSVSVARLESR